MKCWANRPDGRICGRAARYLDERRGCYVCLQHRPTTKGASRPGHTNPSKPSHQSKGSKPAHR